MRETSLQALKKLTKGTGALSRRSFEEFCADIQAAKINELADRLFSVPVKRVERPAWLDAMLVAKKRRNTWKAAEFVDAVYEVAVEQKWITKDAVAGRPASLSFPKAAERIATISGGDALSRAFVKYIDMRVAEDRRT